MQVEEGCERLSAAREPVRRYLVVAPDGRVVRLPDSMHDMLRLWDSEDRGEPLHRVGVAIAALLDSPAAEVRVRLSEVMVDGRRITP